MRRRISSFEKTVAIDERLIKVLAERSGLVLFIRYSMEECLSYEFRQNGGPMFGQGIVKYKVYHVHTG